MNDIGYGTGSMENAIKRAKAVRSEMLGALDQEFGERAWAPATNQDGASRAGCNKDGYETVALRIYASTGGYDDAEWDTAATIIEKIGRKHGYDEVKQLSPPDGSHSMTGLNPDGGNYSFGSDVNSTLSVQTGCYQWDEVPEPDAWQTIDPAK